MYSSIKKAAEFLQDTGVLVRLNGAVNGDLLTAEARYHRQKSCLIINYLNSAKRKATTKDDVRNAREKAFEILTTEFYFNIVHKQEVFRMTTLFSRYRELIHANVDNASLYRSSLLKKLARCHLP